MKKLIGVVIASLMFVNIGYAEIRQIEEKNIGGNYVSTICVDDYKFVVYRDDGGMSMVQFMRQGGWNGPEKNKKVTPAKC